MMDSSSSAFLTPNFPQQCCRDNTIHFKLKITSAFPFVSENMHESHRHFCLKWLLPLMIPVLDIPQTVWYSRTSIILKGKETQEWQIIRRQWRHSLASPEMFKMRKSLPGTSHDLTEGNLNAMHRSCCFSWDVCMGELNLRTRQLNKEGWDS